MIITIISECLFSKLTVTGSDNGMSSNRRQANIWTNAGILLIGPSVTNFREISIRILSFSFKKIQLKMSSAKMTTILSREGRGGGGFFGHWLKSLCSGANVLIHISDIFMQDKSFSKTVVPRHLKTSRCFIRTSHVHFQVYAICRFAPNQYLFQRYSA